MDTLSTTPSTPCPKCAPLVRQLQAEVEVLRAEVADLKNLVRELSGRLKQDSSNSSKPPSSDGYTKPSPKSSRTASGRRSGGQNGHPGQTLKSVAQPDQVVVHPVQLCLGGCGHRLNRRPLLGYEKRQIFDLPELHLRVTEHQGEIKLCSFCRRRVTAPFPLEAQAPTQYGPNLMAWWTYLRVQQLLPLKRIAQMTFDLFNIRVSQATLQGALQRASSRLEGFQAKTQHLLQKAKLAHADETGLRVEGKLYWLHNLSTRLLSWYGVHPKRGRQAIEDFGILKQFRGRLIHDCWSSYFALPHCLHGLCNAHLLRELTFLHEVQNQPWAGQMHALLLEMHQFVTRRRQVASKATPAQRHLWHKRYRRLLREGWAANSKRFADHRSRGRPKQTKAQNLLDRLQRHQTSVLAFLYDFRVPFTNNQAEQDLRMMKVQQKISGTFRTTQGAQVFTRIRSYVSTARKHHHDVFRDIVRVFQNRPFIPRRAL